ncbi:MAG: hypothetical protein ACFFD4_25725 [Candidatus Odinarchaeota archaeon]
MDSSESNQLRFYDGRSNPIDQERLIKFEISSVIERYYHSRNIDATIVIDDLGPIHIDYSNIQGWSEEIPDVDKKSARLFTLWAEHKKTKEIILIVRGFYILVPFKFGEEELKEYHSHHKDTPCYPMAIISSFRTIITDVETLCEVVDKVKDEITANWQKTRKQVIDTLAGTDLWERYVLSFDQIIYFSFLCPSIDRELIEALRRKNYRTTGVMQILASPTPTYDEIMVKSHIEEARKIIKEYK